VQDQRGNVELYYNPSALDTLRKLFYDEGTIFAVSQDCVNSWYPLGECIADLEEANKRFRVNDFELVEITVTDDELNLPPCLE